MTYCFLSEKFWTYRYHPSDILKFYDMYLGTIFLIHCAVYWKVKVKMLVAQSCLTLCKLMHCSPPGSSVHGILQARILERVAMPSSRDLPNPGIEPRSPALQVDSFTVWFFHRLSHQGSPRILEWIAYPFSRGSSWPKNWTRFSALQVDSLPAELSKKSLSHQGSPILW